MKVAYIFSSNLSNKIVHTMILPQLEAGRHSVDVAGMFFFGDNTFILQRGNEPAESLGKFARKNNILLMACDQCAYERKLENNLVDGAKIGCFPDLYSALAPAQVDQIITL